ncbi:MAG: hypothetical protein QM270_02305 [Bacillota bacterium]|nr:hypothetical protein [Bacillota bacterium]
MTDNRVAFDLHILQLERELLEEQLAERHVEQYRQFFFVRETAKQGCRIPGNSDAIAAARRQYVGFNAILTTKFITRTAPCSSLKFHFWGACHICRTIAVFFESSSNT